MAGSANGFVRIGKSIYLENNGCRIWLELLAKKA